MSKKQILSVCIQMLHLLLHLWKEWSHREHPDGMLLVDIFLCLVSMVQAKQWAYNELDIIKV